MSLLENTVLQGKGSLSILFDTSKTTQNKKHKKHSFFSGGLLKELCKSIEQKKNFSNEHWKHSCSFVIQINIINISHKSTFATKKRLKAKRVEMDLHMETVNRPHLPNFAKQRFWKKKKTKHQV